MKTVLYIIFIVLTALVTFFGLGPALFADGTSTERLYTLLVVGFLYILIILLFYYFLKRFKK